MSRFSVSTVFKAVDQMSDTLTKIQVRASGLTSSMSKGLKTVDGHLGKVAQTLGKASMAVGAASVAAGAGLVAISQDGLQFEHTLASLAAVAKPTAAELGAIKNKALEVGSAFGFSSIEVARGMEAMSKQGLSVEEVLSGISGVAAAAAADGSTLDETMGGLLATMAGLGKAPKDLQHIADVMAKAGDMTAAGIGSLTDSMSVFAPTARQMGISVESAVGQLAILQDAGIDASSSGTTLAAVYSKLAAPMGRTEKAIKKLGINVKDSYGNLKPPEQLLNEIFKATSKIEGNVGKAAAITELVGLESQKALSNIIGAVESGKFDKVMQSLTEGVGGYSASIAKAKQDSTTGDWNKFTASLEALKIELFDIAGADLRGLIQGAQEWVKANKDEAITRFRETLSWIKTNLPEIIKWLERVGKTAVAWVTLTTAVKLARVALWGANAALWAVQAATGAWAIATGAATTAETTNTGAVVLGTAARWGKATATWAVQGATWAYNAALVAGTFSTQSFTISEVAGSIAKYAKAAATWVANTATAAYAATTAGATAATVGLTTATWAAVPAVWAAIAPFAPLLGAVAAVSGAVWLLIEAWEKLTSITGKAGLDGVLKALFDAEDERLNREAMERASAERAGGNASPATQAGSSVVSPSEAMASQVSSSTSSASAEVTIKDGTGKAEVTKQSSSGQGAKFNLVPTGAP